jgi:hypothetical protein
VHAAFKHSIPVVEVHDRNGKILFLFDFQEVHKNLVNFEKKNKKKRLLRKVGIEADKNEYNVSFTKSSGIEQKQEKPKRRQGIKTVLSVLRQ